MGIGMRAMTGVVMGVIMCANAMAKDATKIAAPPLPKPAACFYVAPNGSDAHEGTKAQPFATLERARDAIRTVRQRDGIFKGGAQVIVGGGDYAVNQTFVLEPQDCGTSESPIVYRAEKGGEPKFRGGMRIEGWQPVSDAAILQRLPDEARGHVVCADLKPLGITNLPPLVLGGFASGNGFSTHPVNELFFNGDALPMARYPNEGVLHVVDTCVDDGHKVAGIPGSGVGRFKYDGDRPSRWLDDKDAMLYGYWFFDWADSYERIVSIDTAKGEIQLAEPYHKYGYRKNARYYAVNLLSEIDMPGEWYLDRANALVYLYPPSDPAKAVIELSMSDVPLMRLQGVSHVRFEGLTWELGAGDAIRVEGGEQCLFAGCTVRRFGGNGIMIAGGAKHGILSCDIYSMGRGGTCITGGNRKTLESGGHFLVNCDIHDLSRIDHTYTPAAILNGVGCLVAHNRMHHINSSALRVEGNDHRVEFNEVHDVLLESDDQGGADMFGNATFRGNVFRYNYWHHIGNWRRTGEDLACGQAGIRLDDAISGVLIYGNVFFHCSAGKLGFGGVQIHGGKDNVVENNVFAECGSAISFSGWDAERWKNFVANALNVPEIDAALYQKRYPELRTLVENPNANTIRRNLVWKCGQFLLRDTKKSRVSDNVVTDSDAYFVDPGEGNFRAKFTTPPKPPGFASIPFGKMGLYRDAYRTHLPKREIRAARAGTSE